MNKYLSIEEIKRLAASPHATAESLNILLTQAQEQTALREKDILELRTILDQVEKRLGKIK